MKLSDYIFQRLYDLGVSDVFCIPGESVQDLYRGLLHSKSKSILLAHEPSVGYAADAYSRLKGLGAVLVSYGVGSLNLVNAVGQAYAESSPMIVLSGGPGIVERKKYSLLHHKVRTFQTQQKVFDEITAMSIIIDSPTTALEKIELAFQTALSYKKPVYVEIPRDISICEVEYKVPEITSPLYQSTDSESLNEALSEVIELLNKAEKPVILAGVEISRIKMQKELAEFVEKSGLPIASDLLGKSVFPEGHIQSLGTFFGKLSNPLAGRYLEDADLILSLGTILSDVSLGMFSFQLDRTKMIEARIDGLRVKNHMYPDLTLRQLLEGLLSSEKLRSRLIGGKYTSILKRENIFTEIPDQKINSEFVQKILNQFVNRENAPAYRIVSDVGDCLFIGQGLDISKISSFLSPAYYLSMGFSIPGGIGAQIADPSQRSLILIGDGAFQMTGLEIISASRLGLNPIIVLLNNGVYATLEGVESTPVPESYNIGKYEYYKLAEVFGGIGYKVGTTQELQEALHKAETENTGKPIIIQVDLEIDDKSPVLKAFGAMMGESNEESAKALN